jgi:hypothetical protein
MRVTKFLRLAALLALGFVGTALLPVQATAADVAVGPQYDTAHV